MQSQCMAHGEMTPRAMKSGGTLTPSSAYCTLHLYPKIELVLYRHLSSVFKTPANFVHALVVPSPQPLHIDDSWPHTKYPAEDDRAYINQTPVLHLYREFVDIWTTRYRSTLILVLTSRYYLPYIP